MKLVSKTDIQFNMDFNEGYQFIEEPQEIELTNGWTASLVFSTEIDVVCNRGCNYYSEDEYDTSIINPSIEILEVWSKEGDAVFLSAEQENQLKKELLKNL